MATEILDTSGLKCPQPVLKIAAKSPDMKPGDILEVIGDCPTFEKDIRVWCERVNKILLFIKDEGSGKMRCQIQF
ncbi:MAG: sulfurtransferase TusA family protein [Nitrospirota bacterium]